MLRKSILAAGVCAVAAGALLMSNSVVQTSHASDLLVADAHEMAAVKQRQQTMKDVGGNMKIIAEFVKASKGTAARSLGGGGQDLANWPRRSPRSSRSRRRLRKWILSVRTGQNRKSGPTGTASSSAARCWRMRPRRWLLWLNSGDAGTIQAQFATFGKEGCGGCHTTYRGPET